MVVIGLILLAAAVAAVAVLVTQNRSAMVDVHGLGYTWHVHLYWVLVAGLVLAFVGFAGMAMMRAGAVHLNQARRERHGLVRENARLNRLATHVDQDERRPVLTDPPAAPVPAVPVEQPTVATVASTVPSGHHSAPAYVPDVAAEESTEQPGSLRTRKHFFHRTGQA